MNELGIVELIDVCAALQRRNEQLFERLGGWVRSTEGGDAQQLFAEACHRHAWHAGLWADRRPAIGRDPAAVETADLTDAEPAERVASYRSWLDELAERHGSLRHRIDPTLDPATTRVLDLIDADVAALAARAAALA